MCGVSNESSLLMDKYTATFHVETGWEVTRQGVSLYSIPEESVLEVESKEKAGKNVGYKENQSKDSEKHYMETYCFIY